MTQQDCIFCKITNGEIPAVKVWEDEEHLAILDIKPLRDGHTIIIQKKHAETIFDLDDKEYAELMLKAKEVAKRLQSKYKTKRIIMLVEGFEINHAHIHLIPSNTPLKISNTTSSWDAGALKNPQEVING